MARPRSDIEPRILEAARTRFLREGVDGASLRAIATDAGTSIGMVYYYFKTKDELFLAVVEETYVALLDELTRALDPALPPRERFHAIYRRIHQITPREAEVVRLVIREVLVSSKRLASILARFQRGHFPLVLRAITDGIRDGSVRDDLSPMVLLPVVAAVGAIPQFAVARLAPGAQPNLPDVLIDLLYRGISPVGRRPTRRRRRSK
jgi:AcrR family transcriptional regulator